MIQPGQNQYNIDISDLANGLYFVRFVSEGKACHAAVHQTVIDP